MARPFSFIILIILLLKNAVNNGLWINLRARSSQAGIDRQEYRGYKAADEEP